MKRIATIISLVLLFAIPVMAAERNPFTHNDGEGQCYNYKVDSYWRLKGDNKGVVIDHRALARAPYVYKGFVVFELTGHMGGIKKVVATNFFMQPVICQDK